MTAAKAAIALVLALSSPAMSSEWLCVPFKSTGYKWANETWQSVDFNTPHTFLVAEVPAYPWLGGEVGIHVTKVGDANPNYRCPAFQGDQIACGGLGMGFVFNRESLRYQELYGFGYIDGSDAPGNTPYLEIGKCSPLR